MARVLDYCQDAGPCPVELEMAWHIQRFGTAAVLGEGAQSVSLLRSIAAAENTWRSWQSWSTAADKVEWARANPRADALLRTLLEGKP